MDDKRIIRFDEPTADEAQTKSLGKAIAEIVNNIIEINDKLNVDSLSFDFDHKNMSIHIFKMKIKSE
jgi:hypothetical protein